MTQHYPNLNEYLTQCDPKDVMSFKSDKLISVSKLKESVYKAFANVGVNSISQNLSSDSAFSKSACWFNEGEDCEILKASSLGWQKGKIRINVTLEFIPDEPEKIESPLDDIRTNTISK
ncbi:MAG: KGK domain-containing protein [Xenococcus sp. MO_188.B8]|nr:KGK domain-containing protein [Xenococcus sp. MO_188.B8]